MFTILCGGVIMLTECATSFLFLDLHVYVILWCCGGVIDWMCGK